MFGATTSLCRPPGTSMYLNSLPISFNFATIVREPATLTVGSASPWTMTSGKTGTLTLNQMTVRQVFYQGQWFQVEGQGYDKTGAILGVAGAPLPENGAIAAQMSGYFGAIFQVPMAPIEWPIR